MINFLDVFVEEKLRKLYRQIIVIDEGSRKYRNKTIEQINLRDKIRILKIVIEIKTKHKFDFSDDLKRMNEFIEQKKKIKI
jgi:uncharacterized protein (DUF849 family)